LDLDAPDSTLIGVRRQPEGIAITPDGREAWVGSNQDSLVVVVDLTTRRIVDSLTAFGLPYRIAISGDGRRAAITDPAKGTLRIVNVAARRDVAAIVFGRDSILPTAEIPGSPSPEGVVVSGDGRWAFVTLQGRNRLAIVDLDRALVTALIPTGTWSDGVAWSPLRARSGQR
jgi:DNA-binding beta-propeller fold protein YncE